MLRGDSGGGVTIALAAASTLAAFVAGVIAQNRWDLAAWVLGGIAEAMGATRSVRPRSCPGCGRKVRWMKVARPKGYLCLTCAGNPPHPRETPAGRKS
jgi:hypothetical protein